MINKYIITLHIHQLFIYNVLISLFYIQSIMNILVFHSKVWWKRQKRSLLRCQDEENIHAHFHPCGLKSSSCSNIWQTVFTSFTEPECVSNIPTEIFTGNVRQCMALVLIFYVCFVSVRKPFDVLVFFCNLTVKDAFQSCPFVFYCTLLFKQMHGHEAFCTIISKLFFVFCCKSYILCL